MTNPFDLTTPVGKMLRDMWHDVQVASEKNAVAAAKADPEKHKLSKLIADNKPASYRYYPVKYCSVVRWCWANNPNIAGYYLSWREIKTRSTIKRTQFKAHKHRYLGEMRCRDKTKENQ